LSQYILLGKFAEDRKFATWKDALFPRLEALSLEVGQIVSDRAEVLISVATALEAMHSSDLFHGMQDLTRAASGALAKQKIVVVKNQKSP
jgi:hypothetical protein